MADYKIDISQLPEDVREKLAELDLELSEVSTRINNIYGTCQLLRVGILTEEELGIIKIGSFILRILQELAQYYRTKKYPLHRPSNERMKMFSAVF
ncbi:hypothetical protein PGB90_005980 [Kerria lacca]